MQQNEIPLLSKLGIRFHAKSIRITPELLLLLFPVIIAIILISPELLGSRLLPSGEFQSSLDYFRIITGYDHSWRDSAGFGFANYWILTEGGFPYLFVYSPSMYWFFFLFASISQLFFYSPLLLFLYVVWLLFFVGSFLMIRCYWPAPSLSQVIAAFVVGTLYIFNPYMLDLSTGTMSYLSHALLLVAISLYLNAAQAVERKDRSNKILPILFFFVLALWYLSSLGSTFVPFFLLLILIHSILVLIHNHFEGATIRFLFCIGGIGIGVFFLANVHWILPRWLYPRGPLLGDIIFPQPIPHQWDQVVTLGFTGSDSIFRWAYLLTSLAGFVLTRRRATLGLVCVLLVGIFLGKGVAQPLPEINSWIHQNVPFFGALRSTDRYWAFVLFAYAYGIGGLVTWLLSKPKRDSFAHTLTRGGLVCCLPILFILMNKPFVNGNMAGRVFAVTLPPEYRQVDSMVSGKSGSRFLYLPDEPSFDSATFQSISKSYSWSPPTGVAIESSQENPLVSLAFSRVPQAHASRYMTSTPDRLKWYLQHRGQNNRELSQLLFGKLNIGDVVLDNLVREDSESFRNLQRARLWLEKTIGTTPRMSLGGLQIYDVGSAPQHLVFGAPVYVLGDMNAFETIANREPVLANRPWVFLHQNQSLLRTAFPSNRPEILIVDKSLTDLTAEMLPEESFIPLGKFARYYNSPAEWHPAYIWLYNLTDYHGVDFRKDAIAAHGKTRLDLSIALDSQSYVLAAHVLFNRVDDPQTPPPTTIEFSLDGQRISEIETGTSDFSGFLWVAMPLERFASGSRQLSIQNTGNGFGMVDGLAVMPREQWEDAQRRALSLVGKGKNVFYFDKGFLDHYEKWACLQVDCRSDLWTDRFGWGFQVVGRLPADGGERLELGGNTYIARTVGERVVVAAENYSADEEAKSQGPEAIQYEKIDAAHYRVRLNAKDDGVLVFRESYDPYWNADNRHPIVTDYYANGFYFPKGEYTLELYHEPDTVYRLALVFVTTVPVVLIGAIVVLARRR